MRFNNGSAMVDYIVPTAVVGVVAGLALFAMFESGALKKFFSASSNMQIDSSGNAVINQKAGSFGNIISQTNKTSTPVNSSATSQCKNNSCTIDFGDYTLTGIPENLGIGTEVAGSHGADQTDVYANILQQLSEELANTDPKTATLLSNLAKTATSIAERERIISACKNKDLKKQIIGITYSNRMKSVEDDLASFGINGNNIFGQYWSGVSSEDVYNPNFFSSSSGDIYPSSFKEQVIDSNGDVTNYINENPEQLAPAMFGLWQDLLNSNADPEVKQMTSLALSEISNIASGIDLNIERDKSWLGIKTDYTLRTSITNDAATISNVNAAMICAASGETNCR